jgi:hypothetical protein
MAAGKEVNTETKSIQNENSGLQKQANTDYSSAVSSAKSDICTTIFFLILGRIYT